MPGEKILDSKERFQLDENFCELRAKDLMTVQLAKDMESNKNYFAYTPQSPLNPTTYLK